MAEFVPEMTMLNLEPLDFLDLRDKPLTPKEQEEMINSIGGALHFLNQQYPGLIRDIDTIPSRNSPLNGVKKKYQLCSRYPVLGVLYYVPRMNAESAFRWKKYFVTLIFAYFEYVLGGATECEKVTLGRSVRLFLQDEEFFDLVFPFDEIAVDPYAQFLQVREFTRLPADSGEERTFAGHCENICFLLARHLGIKYKRVGERRASAGVPREGDVRRRKWKRRRKKPRRRNRGGPKTIVPADNTVAGVGIVGRQPGKKIREENADTPVLELIDGGGISGTAGPTTRLSIVQQRGEVKKAITAFSARVNEPYFGHGSLSLDGLTWLHLELFALANSTELDNLMKAFFIGAMMECGFAPDFLLNLKIGVPPDSEALDTQNRHIDQELFVKLQDSIYKKALSREQGGLYLDLSSSSPVFCYFLEEKRLGYYKDYHPEVARSTLPHSRFIRIPLTPLLYTIWQKLGVKKKKWGMGIYLFRKAKRRQLCLHEIKIWAERVHKRTGKPISISSIRKVFRSYYVCKYGLDPLMADLISGTIRFENSSQMFYSNIDGEEMCRRHQVISRKILDESSENFRYLNVRTDFFKRQRTELRQTLQRNYAEEFKLFIKAYKRNIQPGAIPPPAVKGDYGSRLVPLPEELSRYFEGLYHCMEPLRKSLRKDHTIQYLNLLHIYVYHVMQLIFALRAVDDSGQSVTFAKDLSMILLRDKASPAFLEERCLPIGEKVRTLLRQFFEIRAEKINVLRERHNLSIRDDNVLFWIDIDTHTVHPLVSKYIQHTLRATRMHPSGGGNMTLLNQFKWAWNALRHFFRTSQLPGRFTTAERTSLEIDAVMGHSTLGCEPLGLYASLPIERLYRVIESMQEELLERVSIHMLEGEE